LKKNDEKIFFNLGLFFGAGMNNTRETLDKTISDVKKMHLTRLFITKQVSCCTVSKAHKCVENALKWQKNERFLKKFLVNQFHVSRRSKRAIHELFPSWIKLNFSSHQQHH
jgi:hypothetical protein